MGVGAAVAAGVAGLGDVHLVAVPERVALDAPAGIEVIRGGDAGSARRETLRIRLPPLDHLPSLLVCDGEVVLHEHHPQHLDLMQPRQEGQVGITAGRGVHRFEQRVPIAPVGQCQLGFPRLAGRHPPGVDPGRVPPAPRVVQQLRHHPRRGHRQLLQAGPHRLPGQLQPVQVADRGDHVGGIGAHLAARAHQPAGGQPLQQRVQHHPIQAAAGDPGPELTQDRVVETRVGQIKPERVLPVDTGADMLGGLTVGQVLRQLENRDQGQAGGRPARLAAHPVGTGELLIREPLAELVAHQHRQRTLTFPAIHRRDRLGDLRHRQWPRLRHHRHHKLQSAARTRGRRRKQSRRMIMQNARSKTGTPRRAKPRSSRN